MHIYIYDSFVNQKKYDAILARIETRLTDLGLNGKICRLGAMKNIREMVENEIKRGAKTIVAVGNDQTVNQVVNAMFLTEQKGRQANSAPLGIIPINKDENEIAAALGISSAEEACEVLSARRVEKLDLGFVNGSPFLSLATITTRGTVLEISKDCSLETMGEGEINVINLALEKFLSAAAFSPQDGILELFIQTRGKKKIFGGAKKADQSILPLKKLTVFNGKNLPLILDGTISVPTPAEISVVKQKLNVIVGKGRRF